MKTVSATEIKNRFGRYLQEAAREPIGVEKSGQTVAVLLSAEEFERLEACEDHFWSEKARAAEAEGSLGVQASMEYLLRRFVEDDEDAGPVIGKDDDAAG